MGIFDAIQNGISGITDSVQGSVGDVAGNLTDNQIIQDAQEQLTNVTDMGTDAVTSVTEQGQTIVDDITNRLGL